MSGRPFLSLFHSASSAHRILADAGGGYALSFATPDELEGLQSLSSLPRSGIWRQRRVPWVNRAKRPSRPTRHVRLPLDLPTYSKRSLPNVPRRAAHRHNCRS